MVKRNRTSNGKNAPRLPKQQLTILAICRFAEPVAMTSVYPYIPEMVKSFDVPTAQVAKWAGLLSLTFSLSQALLGIAWGRASDHFGRKPVIICGLVSTMISSVLFGFSTSLPMAFVTRSMQGLSNGNVGIIRTAVAELVPEKELQPRAFSIMPLVWSVGSIFGPSIGGTLVHPTKRFPSLFGGVELLDKYPFALPNMLISVLFFIGILSGILFLRESLEDRRENRDYGLIAGRLLTRSCRKRERSAYSGRPRYSEEGEAFLSRNEDVTTPVKHKEAAPAVPRGWTQVFTPQSNLNLAAYTFLAMHSVAFDQLLPVFMDLNPVQTIDDPKVRLPLRFRGGFDLDSGRIGGLFTMYGVFCMLIQFIAFPPIVRKYGALKCFKGCAITFPIVYMTIPYMSLLRTNNQRQGATFCLMMIKGWCAIFGFPCSTILLTNSASSLKVLGTLNGVATSISALGRAAGPALSGAMFTLGVEKSIIVLPWWTLAVVALIGAIPVWFLVESQGFSAVPNDDLELSDDDNEDASTDIPLISTAVKTAPMATSLEPEDDSATLRNTLQVIAKTTSRGADGLDRGRKRQEVVSLKRMKSPVGMGEGVHSGLQRQYSTDLGVTNSGHGTGGGTYH